MNINSDEMIHLFSSGEYSYYKYNNIFIVQGFTNGYVGQVSKERLIVDYMNYTDNQLFREMNESYIRLYENLYGEFDIFDLEDFDFASEWLYQQEQELV